MITINLFDANFPQQPCSVAGAVPETMRYVRGCPDWGGITLFTDGQMFTPEAAAQRSRYKIGWLHEGYELRPENYERSIDARSSFDAILTTSEGLIARDPAKYLRTIRGGCWMPRSAWGLGEPKQPRAAMVVSDKHQTSGHLLRWELIRTAVQYPALWLYGPSFEEIGPAKWLAYTTASHAVVIEAERSDNFFSEHLLDAIALGCTPIYWGCSNIGEYLDTRGLIICESIEDIRAAVHDLPAVPVDALAANLDRLPEYAITEDWLLRGPLRPFVEALCISM